MSSEICEVSYSVRIDADSNAVWDKICEPCSILQWNERIAKCENSLSDQGQIVRHYTLHPVSGFTPTMVETELLRSDAIMTITYMVEMTVLPITDYVAQILVTPLEGGGCEAQIRSRFVDTKALPGAETMVAEFYKVGLDALAVLMEQ
jgi:hypothetical protein